MMGLKNSIDIDPLDLLSDFTLFPWPLTLEEYENIVTHYVQNYIEKHNAKRISTKKIPFGS